MPLEHPAVHFIQTSPTGWCAPVVAVVAGREGIDAPAAGLAAALFSKMAESGISPLPPHAGHGHSTDRSCGHDCMPLEHPAVHFIQKNRAKAWSRGCFLDYMAPYFFPAGIGD
jgi:hypothetical protein